MTASEKKKVVIEKFKRLLTAGKKAKSVLVLNNPEGLDQSKLLLILKSRGELKAGEDVDGLVAWAELDEKQTKKLIRDLTLKLRYMKRKEIERV